MVSIAFQVVAPAREAIAFGLDPTDVAHCLAAVLRIPEEDDIRGICQS